MPCHDDADGLSAGADESYGGGHAQASGGALRLEDWPAFLRNIGLA